MALARERQKLVLFALVAVLAALIVYRIRSDEGPKTAPLTYERGAVATSTVRGTPGESSDPLSALLERRAERYPGVSRDIFRMEEPAPPKRQHVAPPPPPSPVPASPQPHVKTPEELAAEAALAAANAARADMAKFRFLGYLTEKDNTLFLSKDGELFIVRSGDKVLKNYKIQETGRDYVILLDTVNRIEARVDQSGSQPVASVQSPLPQAQAPQQPPPLSQQPQQQLQQLPHQQQLQQSSPQPSDEELPVRRRLRRQRQRSSGDQP